MYIRQISRTNKDGTKVTYVQLAHNYWNPESQTSRANVVHSFGRMEDVDLEGLRRLARSIGRFLGPEDALRIEAELTDEPGLRFLAARPMGGAWALTQLWDQLHLGPVLQRLATHRHFRTDLLGAILAMVANRCLDPKSKHAIPEWLDQDVALPGVEASAITDDVLYRAMDFAIAHDEAIQEAVFHEVAHLLNLEVDLLFYDTTSLSIHADLTDEDRAELQRLWEAHDAGEAEEPALPRPQVVNDPPLRERGHAKNKRTDLPQIVIGMAVTKEGIPVRCWTFPGNTADVTTVQKIKRDLVGWKLGRVVLALDRGMVSEENLTALQQAGGHYIVGEKLRSAKAGPQDALARAGRYSKIRGNLLVKEVEVGDGEKRQRYVVVKNPHQARLDAATRERTLRRLESELAGLQRSNHGGDEHTKAVCRLIAHRTLGRYLKQSKRGKLSIDRAKVRAEEKLDGKYLLRSSDDTLSAEDIALGYKQLLEVERAWRDMKTTLEISPMYHRLADRIRAHVLLCMLALLLVRVAERRTGQSWNRIRTELDRIHEGRFRGKAGEVVRTSELTSSQLSLLNQLGIAKPPAFISLKS